MCLITLLMDKEFINRSSIKEATRAIKYVPECFQVDNDVVMASLDSEQNP